MKQADFYAQVDIQPFRRDLSDKRKYFEQRDSLLRHLGIVPRLLKGSNILEFGPGHGENALYLLQQCPAKLVLVELSEECVEASKVILEPYKPEGSDVEYHLMNVDDYASDILFDLVIFEGVIPFEPDPAALLKHTSKYVAEGGILSITTIDSVSFLSEVLRRMIASLAAPIDLPFEERLEKLLPIFSPHLETLTGMTRSHEHWLIDQMHHPWSGNPLSILDAAKVIDDGFDLYSSSPHFMRDWRWFRNIHGDRKYLENVEEQYLSNVHNLIDYRQPHPSRMAEENRKIVISCDRILQLVKAYEAKTNMDAPKDVLQEVRNIVNCFGDDAQETVASLNDYVNVLESYIAGNPHNDFGSFTNMFGRGQQYVSFIRRNT